MAGLVRSRVRYALLAAGIKAVLFLVPGLLLSNDGAGGAGIDLT